MEEKGLIYREPNANDGRGVLIFLSKFGKEKKEHQNSSSFFIKLLLCSQKLLHGIHFQKIGFRYEISKQML